MTGLQCFTETSISTLSNSFFASGISSLLSIDLDLSFILHFLEKKTTQETKKTKPSLIRVLLFNSCSQSMYRV